MRVQNQFSTNHEYYVHDVKFNYYGQRLATCASDERVKIWDLHEGKWQCTYSWQAHMGSVWKVDWAHPEFGQVIASCSSDRSVHIWEEMPLPQPHQHVQQQQQPAGAAAAAAAAAPSPSSATISSAEPKFTQKWSKLAQIVDATDTVSDIKFAPRHQGLKLAVCSLDGHVRIYEATDIMNLSHWQIEQDIEVVTQQQSQSQQTALASSSLPPKSTAAAAEATAASAAAPVATATAGTAAAGATPSSASQTPVSSSNISSSTSSTDLFSVAASQGGGGGGGLTPLTAAKLSQQQSQISTLNGATCVSWCPSRFEEPMIVIGCQDGSIKIWQYSEKHARKWQMLLSLENAHASAVHDVCWAPSMGRSYHLIASAGKDGAVIVWQLYKEGSSTFLGGSLLTASSGGAGAVNAPPATVSTPGTASTSATPLTSSSSSAAAIPAGPASISSAAAAALAAQSSSAAAGALAAAEGRSVITVSSEGTQGTASTNQNILGRETSVTVGGSSASAYQIKALDVIRPHANTEVWRVEWNVTGTVLASAGDDGTVKLYRRRLFDYSANSDAAQSASHQQIPAQSAGMSTTQSTASGFSSRGASQLQQQQKPQDDGLLFQRFQIYTTTPRAKDLQFY